MRWFRFAAITLVVTILQTSLVGVIAFLRPEVKPDLLVILLVFFAIHSGPHDAIITSFVIGLAADLSNPIRGLMGPQIISFGVLGTLLSDVHGVISIRRMPYQAATIFIMGALTALLSYLLTLFRADSVAANLTAEALWQPLYSAIIGPFLFVPIAWWMRMTRRARKRRQPGTR
jgi:rod shape-determining protein MreD